MIIKDKKISNHPDFLEVERFVTVLKAEHNAYINQFTFLATIKYVKDGIEIHSFIKDVPNWRIDNSFTIPNEEEIEVNAYDFFNEKLKSVPYPSLIEDFIPFADSRGVFNIY